MPQTIRAVVVDPAAPGKLAVKAVELRDPDRDEVGVRVTAISLNRGETRRALQVAEPGWRPGWDFAGIVETAAADGSGPKPGTRVVGLLPHPGRIGIEFPVNLPRPRDQLATREHPEFLRLRRQLFDFIKATEQ